MKAIGIDIGTTSICGVSVDIETGEILKSVTRNSEAFLPGCAEWEKIQDAEKLISLATEIVDSLIEADTAVIGVTGQMHGIVYIDETGKAISPLYTWQDQRGTLPLGDTTYAKAMNSFTGYGNVTDFYNRENGIRPQEAVCFCTIHDYFVMRLCQNRKPWIHASDAASFGSENRSSAEITEEFQIAGRYGEIPVSVAIGDNQASVFSTLADENDVLVNIGTGSQVSVISDKPVIAENVETRPYFGGKYLIVGAALCGGRAYSMLKNFYGEVLSYVAEPKEEDIYNIMSNMLESCDVASLSVDTRFAGTRSNPTYTGSISGITTGNFTPGQLTYGVLSGMGQELYDMFTGMQTKTTGIVGSGNAIRKNKFLIEILEKQFGGKMKIPVHLEEAACGAAMFGMVACGTFGDEKQVKKMIRYA